MLSSSPTLPHVKPTFDEAYPEIARIVASRRGAWTYLSILSWEDVSQELLLRLYNKWPTYDPKKAPKLEHWVNTLITNALLNLRRDNYLRLASPCVGGGKTNGKSCVFNLGGDACAHTKSGKKCDECPIFKKWKEKREAQFNIKSHVALENHSQEVSNTQSDFTDIQAVKQQIDEIMMKELNRWEGKIYRAIFVRHMTPTQVSEWLVAEAKTRKRPLKPTEQTSYQAVLIYQREFKGMMREILQREHGVLRTDNP